MRHLRKGKKLRREKSARKALFALLVSSLILHEKIKTTEKKAKAVLPLVDKVIKLAKQGKEKELIQKGLTKNVIAKLIEEIAKWYPKRTSGYARIVALYYRKGDNTKVVQLSLLPKDSEETPKTTETKK